MRSATIAGLLLTGFVFFIGYIEETTYYHRLGIADAQLDFSASHFMAHSFSVLAMPVVLFAALILFDFTIASIKHRTQASGDYLQPVELFTFVPPIGMAAAVAAYWLFYQLAGLGDSDQLGLLRHGSPVFDQSWFDLIIHTIGLALGLWLLSAQTRKEWKGTYAFMFGRTKSATVWLVVLATGAMLMAAGIAGNDRGNDAAWAAWECASVPVVDFTPRQTSLEAEHEYWLILDRHGQYFLRDLATAPEDRNITIIRAAVIDQVNVTWSQAGHC